MKNKKPLNMKVSKLRKDSAILAWESNNIKAAFNAIPNEHPIKDQLKNDVEVVAKYLTADPSKIKKTEEYMYFKAGQIAREVFEKIEKALYSLETF